MYYKNISNSVKTFYNVEFAPGQAKEVPGYVNAKGMILVDKLPEEKISLPEEKKEVKEVKEAKKKVKPDELVDETPSENIIKKSN